ncbi:MAG: sulfatase-like hydrolase/transferase [Acidobacteriota bacterium]
MRSTWAGLALCAVVASPLCQCTRSQPVLVRDLLSGQPDRVRPTTLIRAGDETVRQLIYRGLAATPDQKLAAAPGTPASFGFYATSRRPSSLVLSGSADPPCEVALRVNGKDAGRRTVPAVRGQYRFPLAAGLIQDGLNEGALQLAAAPAAAGTGAQNVARGLILDSICLGDSTTPVVPPGAIRSQLVQSAGSEVEWFMVPAQDRLELSGVVSAPEASSCEAAITIETDSSGLRTLWRSPVEVRGERSLSGEIDLAPFAGSGARICAKFSASRGEATLTWNRFRLIRDTTGNSAPAPVQPAVSRPNVIIFLVDTLRRDHLPVYGYRQQIAPSLSKFARESIVFENAWSQSSWTNPAVASLFTGEVPATHGIRAHTDSLHPSFETIAEFHKRHGYSTMACVSNAGIKSEMGYGQGFDDYQFHWRKDAGVLVDIALDRIRTEPFFIYIHANDPHYPYTPAPAPFDSFIPPRPPAILSEEMLTMSSLKNRRYVPDAAGMAYLLSIYDSEIRLVDHHFGRMIEALKSRGVYDRTLVVFIADHGEEFNDHGGYYHGHSLYDELTRIPMIAKPPVPYTPERRARPVRTIDVYPTVAALLGEAPALPGRDWDAGAVGCPDDIAVYSETELQADYQSVVLGRYKLILLDHSKKGVADGFRLFDLQADPGEKRNLVREQPIRAEYMAALVRRLHRDAAARMKFSADAIHRQLDEDTRRQLETLGYLDPAKE